MDEPQRSSAARLDLQQLWAKYEDIAMHFNDLLMRLRAQSLAGIAALSTVVGVLAKNEIGNISVGWFMAGMIFSAMALFWVAIWCLDFLYYNRLLRGAVAALALIEKESQTHGGLTSGINMSTLIEAEFAKPLLGRDIHHFLGVVLFYGIVLFALVAGALSSFVMNRFFSAEPNLTSWYWCDSTVWRPSFCDLWPFE